MEKFLALLVTLMFAFVVVVMLLGTFALILMWPLFAIPTLMILAVWPIIYGMWKDSEDGIPPPIEHYTDRHRHTNKD